MQKSCSQFRLVDRVCEWALSEGVRPAYIDSESGTALTYAGLAAAVTNLRARLRHNLLPGTVILRSDNRTEFVVWFLALIAQGNDVCPVHPNVSSNELELLCGRTSAVAIVGLAEGSVFDGGIGVRQYSLADCWAANVDASPGDRDESEPGNLLLTSSGTTGRPKIVVRTAQSLVAVSEAMVDAIGFVHSDQVLAAVPLSHSYGIEHGLLAPLWAGSSVHLCRGLDLSMMSTLLRDTITIFPAVPSMIEMLATLEDAPLEMPKLKAVYSAGGALPAIARECFAKRFGIDVGQVYGMSEIGSVTYNNPEAVRKFPSSVGRPMRGVEIKTIDGEVAVRAASMFGGYLDEPAEFDDGFFRTGDLGHIDEAGNVYITGRSRLLIDVGGMKVNPAEVEDVIARHAEVLECVVVAFQQSDTIRRLRAIVVPREPANPPTPESIRGHVRNHLAGFKVPRIIEFREQLPRSSAGKVLRSALEAESCEP